MDVSYLIESPLVPSNMKKLLQSALWIYLIVGLYLPILAQPKPTFLKSFAYSKPLGGYYLVYRDHYFGLLDSMGRQFVPCHYDDIDRFYDGMAEVVLKGKHGYINQQGKVVIPLLYTRANPFQKGEALVVTSEGDIGYLNTKGQQVMPFSQLGRPYFKGQYTKGWALQTYIGKQERESIGEFYSARDSPSFSGYVPAKTPAVESFCKTGLTLIFSGDKRFRRYGLADSVGHIIFPLIFEDISDTKYAWRDWVRVKKNNRYGFIDRQSGKLVIPLLYEDTQPSVYNRIWVKKNGQWGSIDRTGNVVVPFHYSAVSAYSEQRAIVQQANHYGYVDTTAKLIIPLQFDQASFYRQGKAKVYQGNHWLELDPQGSVLASGLQADVFWDWVKYSAFLSGILFFIFYVYRNKLAILS